MKKVIGLLFVTLLLISLSPVKQSEAAAKLNKSKLTIMIDETYNLSLSGAGKGIKWSSSDKAIVKVSSTGKIKGIDVGEATVTATYNKKKYTCKVTVEYDVDSMLLNTFNWVIEIWNDGFCNIYHFVEDGTDAYGQDMDINLVTEKIDRYMEEFEKYDKFVKSLSKDDYYEDLNEQWPKLTSEIQYLYDRIKEEIPRASDPTYEFDYRKLFYYVLSFTNEIS